MPRPAQYRKTGPWEDALRLLHGRRFCLRQIVEVLNGGELLDYPFRRRQVAAQLDRWGRAYDDAYLTAVLDLANGNAAPLTPYTRRSVYYHLRCLGLKLTGRVSMDTLRSCRAHKARVYAWKHGWGHLLPHHDETHKRHVAGLDLTAREVDVLDSLADQGPATCRELADRLGLRTLKGGTRHKRRRETILTRLLASRLVVTAGLVRRPGVDRPVRLYRLAPDVKRRELSLRGTAIDWRFVKNQKATDSIRRYENSGLENYPGGSH
jgi:hypothetical protein